MALLAVKCTLQDYESQSPVHSLMLCCVGAHIYTNIDKCPFFLFYFFCFPVSLSLSLALFHCFIVWLVVIHNWLSACQDSVYTWRVSTRFQIFLFKQNCSIFVTRSLETVMCYDHFFLSKILNKNLAFVVCVVLQEYFLAIFIWCIIIIFIWRIVVLLLLLFSPQLLNIY